MSSSIVPPQTQHLTNGWEPDLAAEDTLVRRAVLVHASWPVEVASSAGRPCHSGPRWAGGWIGDRGALTNPVILVQPMTEARSVLDEVSELFPAQVPYFVVSPWPTPDLRSHGLELIGHPPLMVRFPDTREAPGWPGVETWEVLDAEQLEVAERILVEGYPMPDLEPMTSGELLGPSILQSSTRIWIGSVDGQPASVAAAHMHAGTTLVEYVAALPAARGRGAGAAVTWAATLADRETPAVLIASDDGRRVYEAMGYQAIERWTAWFRPAG